MADPGGRSAIALDEARPYQPVYPGDDLRCAIEDGRTTCSGGLATSRAAHVTVESRTAAVLHVDGKAIGSLPVNDLALRVGRRELDLAYPDGKHARYALIVEPDQHIRVTFPVPAGMAASPAPAAAPPAPVGEPPVASFTDDDTGRSDAP